MIQMSMDSQKLKRDLQVTIFEETRKANEMAVKVTAQYALGQLKPNLSFPGKVAPIGQLGTRTGRLLSQAGIRIFRQRNGLFGASVRILGDRAHVAHINEVGAATHGGRYGKKLQAKKASTGLKGLRVRLYGGDRGPLPARAMFALTWKRIESQMAVVYSRTFDANYKST